MPFKTPICAAYRKAYHEPLIKRTPPEGRGKSLKMKGLLIVDFFLIFHGLVKFFSENT
jgi:hypothetical protein